MPTDPTANVSERYRLPTRSRDVGQVAPDFEDRQHANALVIRPEYRVSLKLGKIDDLCPDEPDTEAGRRMRLQLLAYFYKELDAPATELKAAYDTVWNWFTTELGKSDADIDQGLVDEIVENGAIPAPGSFAKVWLPGGHCYQRDEQTAALGSAVVAGKHPMVVKEDELWDANSVLGAIPIIAVVEKRRGDGSWVPAEDVWVHLQLAAPDEVAGDHKAPDARATTTHSPAPANPGPKGYVDDVVADPKGDGGTRAAAAPEDDAQVDNCHDELGGKRGRDEAGRVFELQVDAGFRGGFYEAHPARTIDGRPPFYPHPERAGDGHAVRAKSNEEGQAGFIFRPARTAGDRYKLRAFIGPDTLESDGTDFQAVRVETGTFVVWKRIRIAKYLQWDYPASFTQPAAPPASGRTQVQNMHFRVRNMGPINLTTVADEYEKAYIDVEIESTAAVHKITAAEWTAARNHALTNWNTVNGWNPVATVNLQNLFPPTNTTASLANIVNRTTYNANRNTGGDATGRATPYGPFNSANNTYWNWMSSLVSGFNDAFVHYWTRGALPFVVVQSPFGDELTYSGTVPATTGNGFLTTSGVASPWRGCHLFWGGDFYRIFSYQGPAHPQQIDYNTVHEMGHCHFGRHHWTNAGPPKSGGGPWDHDQFDFCVMGYLPVPGDFCGRCLLRLRGWDVTEINRPAPAPGP